MFYTGLDIFKDVPTPSVLNVNSHRFHLWNMTYIVRKPHFTKGVPVMTTTTTKSANTKSTSVPIFQVTDCGAAISSGKMEQFVSTFQQSARRWEIIVYPALFAFVVLAGYGFFLIYSLTSDMSKMANSMDSNMEQHMESMTKSIITLSENVTIMTRTMNKISVKLNTLQPMLRYVGTMDESMASMVQSMAHMDKMMTRMDISMAHMDKSIWNMDQSIGSMDKSIVTMDESMQNMDQSMRIMTAATDQLRRDLTIMNRSISNFARPASFVNSFMPW
jgi:uncharacterized protein YoxC